MEGVEKMNNYEKEIAKSIQNQVTRQQKQKLYGISDVNLNDRKDTNAVMPSMPDPNVTVLCQFCGAKIPPTRPGVPQKVVDRERKFRVCQTCRMDIVGPGGALDRSTPQLQATRDISKKD